MVARKKSKTDKQKQKQKIIKAAISIFSKEGFTKTKVEDIAKRAKIAKGLVYYYFKTKEEIYMESLYSIRAQMREFVEKNISEDLDPFEKIRERTKNVLKFFSKNQEMFIVFAYQDQVKKLSEYHKKRAVEYFFNQIEIQSGYFKEAQNAKLIDPEADPESLALMLFSQTNIFMSYALMKNEKMDPNKLFDLLDRYFFKNLKISS